MNCNGIVTLVSNARAGIFCRLQVAAVSGHLSTKRRSENPEYFSFFKRGEVTSLGGELVNGETPWSRKQGCKVIGRFR